MTNVIDFGAEKDKRAPQDEPRYEFSLDVYTHDGGDLSGRLHGFDAEDGCTRGERLRIFARFLEDLAANLRDDAQQAEPDDDGFVLGRFTVWESSRVRSWVSNRCGSEEQVEWMRERLDDAKQTIQPAS